jgi:hypothetical protein
VIWTRNSTNPALFRARWQSIRRGGRRRYVLLHGALGWGWPVAFFYTLISQVLWSPPGPFLGRLGIALVVFSVGGVAFGASIWSLCERRYLDRGELPREGTGLPI